MKNITNNKWKALGAGLTVGVAALVLAGCPSQNNGGNSTNGTANGGGQTGASVNIAANLPLTGPIASWSGQYPDGFKMGVAEACKDMGVSPERVQVDFQDNTGKAPVAVTVMQKQMLSNPDVYIAGTSDMAKAIAPKVDSANVPYLLAAFDAFLSQGSPNRMRILPHYKIEGPLYVKYAKQRKAKRVYIIALNISSIQEEFSKIVEPGLSAAKIAHAAEAFEFDTKQYRTIALKAKQYKPDLIFVSGFSFHIYPLLNALRTQGLIKDGSVMCTMDFVDLLHNKTPKAELVGVAFASPLMEIPKAVPSAADWRKRYQQQVGKEATYVAAYAYDTARVLVTALNKSGKVDTASIRGALPFDGITGSINLDKDGDLVSTIAVAKVGANGAITKVTE